MSGPPGKNKAKLELAVSPDEVRSVLVTESLYSITTEPIGTSRICMVKVQARKYLGAAWIGRGSRRTSFDLPLDAWVDGLFLHQNCGYCKSLPNGRSRVLCATP